MRAVAAGLLVLLLAGCASSDDGSTPTGDPTPAAAQSGIATGRLTAAQPDASHDVELTAGHDEVRFALVLVSNAPQNLLQLNVTSPDGRSRDLQAAPVLYALPGTVPVAAFGDPAAGTWTNRVHLGRGAAADYEVHWCTGTGHDAANRACPLD